MMLERNYIVTAKTKVILASLNRHICSHRQDTYRPVAKGFTKDRIYTLGISALASLYLRLYRCTSPLSCWLWFCSDVMRCLISRLMGPVCSLAARFCSNSIRSISYSLRSWARRSSSWMTSVRSFFCAISSSLFKKVARIYYGCITLVII